MLAQDLMTGPAITCHVNDSLDVAARKMWDADIGIVGVVNDDGKLTSVITDRDICIAAFTQGRALGDLLVNSAMATTLVTTAPEATITDVEHLMAKYQIRRIPIVDDEGTPIGIISMNDLAILCMRPDSAMKHGPSNVANTLAAVSEHRNPIQNAA